MLTAIIDISALESYTFNNINKIFRAIPLVLIEFSLHFSQDRKYGV